ncbi:MAG TPA: hypothetical protein IGR64_09625 [Leptolyngbyaceae cyanobacterium M65_K2018_010]|nr:hypothetical protein [Leptolyngbyaceae cyanobacterium M65_K2018_010]
MAFFRSYIAPLLIVLIFSVAMLAVSARIFLPADMVAPAPIEDPLATLSPELTTAAELPGPELSELIHGPAHYQLEG